MVIPESKRDRGAGELHGSWEFDRPLTVLGFLVVCGLVLAASLAVAGCSALYDHFGGNLRGEPDQMQDALSPEAKELINSAFTFTDINADQLVDYHTHVVGLGMDMPEGLDRLCKEMAVDGSGLYINPVRFSWSNPYWKVITAVQMSAARVVDREMANEEYARRLLELVRNIPGHGKFHLLAMDAYHRDDGTPDWEKTDIYVPNRYVVDLAKCLNSQPELGGSRFVPVISLHPYRQDAVEELERYARQGVRFVKWLPNIMNIDPANMEKNKDYYEAMARLDMILITHTGQESSLRVPREEHQGYGNPLLYRQALDVGVTVLMAHSGRDGENPDKDGAPKPNFRLFLKMMREEKYKGLLFGDLSALTIRNRTTLDHLAVIMEDPRLHGRMVNGSDYPLPAVSFLNPTMELLRKGFISKAEQEALDEIYGYNPLLFDFVVKRTIRHPKQPDLRLPESMFVSIDARRRAAEQD